LTESPEKSNKIIRESINTACDCVQKIYFIRIRKSRINVGQDSSLRKEKVITERTTACYACWV